MSGGHWNYMDRDIDEKVSLEDLPVIFRVLKKCFRQIDLSESSDLDRETVEPRIYNFLKDLGDHIFIVRR